MAFPFVANGITFKPLSTAIRYGPPAPSLVPGHYVDQGRYGPPPTPGGLFVERQDRTYPGVDWTQQVEFGTRNRQCFATLIWAGSPDACVTQFLADEVKLIKNARYDITISGKVIHGCKVLMPGGWGTPSWINMNNACLLILPVIFVQLSDPNGSGY